MSKGLVQRLRIVSNMINMGEKIRWGEETALMDEAADLIERQSKALDAAMMVVWWVVGEGIIPAHYDIDPDQVMIDNVADITGDGGEYWEAMFHARALTSPEEGE